MGRLRVRAEYSYACTSTNIGGGGGDSLIGGGAQTDTGGSSTNCSWSLQTTVRYIYDGNRVIQERDGSNVPTVSYTRGSDLSGTLEGAGGIGGLLARSAGYSAGNWSSHNSYFADGNGNITYLVNSSQTLAAQYRYDPFGNQISSSGTLASANTYRFSSKELHVNSGLYYYLYRFYNPGTQRWINGDPIHEFGFLKLKGRKMGWHQEAELDLYTFVANDPISKLDYLGLTDWLILGGKCCNKSGGTEWWIADGVWNKLPPGKCTGTWDDCDGVTCGGGFYYIQ